MENRKAKLNALKEILQKEERIAVAFSGGVDSTFLLKTALDVLGAERVLAVTVSSCLFPGRELAEAEQFCRTYHIRQRVLSFDALAVHGFSGNPKDRCYLCKRSLFADILRLASEEGITAVAEGSNMDDVCDYRPGLKAVAELGILSPLRHAGLYKEEIRMCLKEDGISVWERPSFACLASRFVYGETITKERLAMVEKAEQVLTDLGFTQLRVRIHGGGREVMARIEVPQKDFSALLDKNTREAICKEFKALGFSYVATDLEGYRTGSMNEMLDKKQG